MTPLAERFWRRVDKTPGLGPVGQLLAVDWSCQQSRLWPHNRQREANFRSSPSFLPYSTSTGPTPYAMHRCDNKLCVRWEHLLEGSHTDNMQDMIAKGRNRFHFTVSTHLQTRP